MKIICVVYEDDGGVMRAVDAGKFLETLDGVVEHAKVLDMQPTADQLLTETMKRAVK